MTADTPTAGYPVHAVARYAVTTNPHGVRFTAWEAQCATRGSQVGTSPFGRAGSARRLELCPKCFPGRTWNACKIDKPVQVDSL